MGLKAIPNPIKGVPGDRTRVNAVEYYHRVVLSTSGTISSQDSAAVSGGITCVKTAAKTGRYTLTLPTKYQRLLWVDAMIFGTADTAYGATTLGLTTYIRNDNVGAGTLAGTVDVQFVASASNNDAEVQDNCTLIFQVVVAEGV